ncbi:MAG: cytochrome c maturation protein CcmE [Gammaproteobacteria bacterium]|nr:MAG: cytochrome c maturation protein CcmE [Gammaproteobacteria bacterium]
MNPVRKQRLIIVLMIVFGVGMAVGLVAYALRQNIDAFYTPDQVVKGEVKIGQRIRIGGLVVEGSVRRAKEGLLVSFDLSDGVEQVTVQYRGILPDLFKEGQGILAKGHLLEPRLIEASEVLAKHDENYMSPEIKAAMEKAGHVEKP